MTLHIDRAKMLVRQIPVLRTLAGRLYVSWLIRRFPGSAEFWLKRYERGGTSGAGSYDHLAQFKAEVVNGFVDERGVSSVIEYGCGDGNQLTLASYPQYIGFDISPLALERCRDLFRGDATKSFRLVDDYDGEVADLTLSLDVIYHLIEDDVFESHMDRLFGSSTRFVIVFSSNRDEQEAIQAPHVRHREFADWVDTNAGDWRLIDHIPNRYTYSASTDTGSFADFYIYEKI